MTSLPRTRSRHAILILGDHSTFLASVADGVRRQGRTVVRAGTTKEAIERCENRSLRATVALIGEDFAADRCLEEALSEIRVRVGGRTFTPIAIGTPPDPERRVHLRAAGIEQALWTPFGSNALRFQLNRALAGRPMPMLRHVDRVPTEIRAQAWSTGRGKETWVYSLSTGGAYLTTTRPWVVGSRVDVELPLGHRRLVLGARVLYTNVPGNLARNGLPFGMAVRFGPLADAEIDSLRREVANAQRALVV